jgi:hypothetical protein
MTLDPGPHPDCSGAVEKKRSQLIPTAISLSVAGFLVFEAIREYGPHIKDVSDGMVESLCHFQPANIVVDSLIQSLTSCISIPAMDQGIPFKQHWDDGSGCDVVRNMHDHFSCPGFHFWAGITHPSLLNIPFAVISVAVAIYYNGVFACIITALGLVACTLIARKELIFWARERFSFQPFSIGIVRMLVEIYFGLVLVPVMAGGAAFMIKIPLNFAFTMLSGILGLLLWFVGIPTVLFVLLQRPVELYHVYNAVKELKEFVAKKFS